MCPRLNLPPRCLRRGARHRGCSPGGVVDPCTLSDLMAEVQASTSLSFGINFLPSCHYQRPLLIARVAEAGKAAGVANPFSQPRTRSWSRTSMLLAPSPPGDWLG
jgi:hypothetical protein